LTKPLIKHADVNEDDDHRYMMFSATFNKFCRQIARQYLSTDHVRIRVGRAGSAHKHVIQQVRRFPSLVAIPQCSP
jgi:ATP-dependent RNA helicase DDX3X